MATLTVQDDTGTETDANSYISEADADTYFSDRNNSTWDAATSENKIFALIKAWQYMDTEFLFIGTKLTCTQNTEWPRQNAYDTSGCLIEGIPVKITYAQSEYALRALSEELLQDITYDSNKLITRQKNIVGPVEQETEYSGYIISRSYPSADILLKGLVLSNMAVTRG